MVLGRPDVPLPAPLQPAWPLFKRGHLAATRRIGAVTRRTTSLAGERAVPHQGTDHADETVRLEPESVTLHEGGPGEILRRTLPVGTPPEHWGLARRASYDVPRRFTLEIKDGAIVGNYAAHITPGGVLDYETSTYFGVTGWKDHPIYIRSRLPELQHFDGTLVSLATRGSHANYYHFLLDVVPRYGVLRECLPDLQPDAWFVNTASGYQRQLLGLIGLDTDRIRVVQPGKKVAVRAGNLVVPCIPNPDLIAPTWTTSWLKENLPAKSLTDRPKRIYITRGNAKNTRRLVNEDEIFGRLEKLGFVKFDPGTVSVQDQIDTFTAAEVIVAPHGAALANLTFCSPGVRILELFHPRYVNPCYWVIADNIPDVRYRYLVCGEDDRPPGSPLNGVLTDIECDPVAFDRALDDLLA